MATGWTLRSSSGFGHDAPCSMLRTRAPTQEPRSSVGHWRKTRTAAGRAVRDQVRLHAVLRDRDGRRRPSLQQSVSPLDPARRHGRVRLAHVELRRPRPRLDAPRRSARVPARLRLASAIDRSRGRRAGQVFTPSYLLWRRKSAWAAFGRAGVPIVASAPSCDVRTSKAAGGAAWFFLGGVGLVAEIVGDVFYGVGTSDIATATYIRC